MRTDVLTLELEIDDQVCKLRKRLAHLGTVAPKMLCMLAASAVASRGLAALYRFSLSLSQPSAPRLLQGEARAQEGTDGAEGESLWERIASLRQMWKNLKTNLATFRFDHAQALVLFQTTFERRFGEQQHLTAVVHDDVRDVRRAVDGVDHRMQQLEDRIDVLRADLARTIQSIDMLRDLLTLLIQQGANA